LLNKQQSLVEQRAALSHADEQICSQIVKSMVENSSWETKNGKETPVVVWKKFEIVANRQKNQFGGPQGIRTPHPRLAKAVLYQMS
jgi:hypothetical protein